MISKPPATWPGDDGNPLSCRDKLKVLAENHTELAQMLQDTAAHLNVDVVAFVRPSDDQCVYATSLSKEIHNLDLVLVEMRGDLFRFIQSSRESVVMNDASDTPARPRKIGAQLRASACSLSSGTESAVTMSGAERNTA